ncbi:allene oxide synthase-lipoxygenase protein [Plakobranchus ocellatus]|uniref:Allene oxide synthase-lipoxygenase protein n=1 Tax=Plakobranchus ocellatus TaxID=259542 RepID=A0AAV4AXU9_9GAST|nr:allene oxide synthase-lipoxygenase protein [Plakobranchus ocellatus]
MSISPFCAPFYVRIPVTDDLVKPLLEGLTLEEAIAQKRLFLCDLQILHDLPVRENFVLCAPIALFFLDKTKLLQPLAIQLFQQPGPENPV